MAKDEDQPRDRIQTMLWPNPGYYDDIGLPLDYTLDDYLGDPTTEEAAAFALRIMNSRLAVSTYTAQYNLAAREGAKVKNARFDLFPYPRSASLPELVWFLKEAYDLETVPETIKAFGPEPAAERDGMVARLEVLLPWVEDSETLDVWKDYAELLEMEFPEVRDKAAWATYGYWRDKERTKAKVPSEHVARNGIAAWLKAECKRIRKDKGLKTPRISSSEVVRIDNSKATEVRMNAVFTEFVDDETNPYVMARAVYTAGNNLDANYEASMRFYGTPEDKGKDVSLDERRRRLQGYLGTYVETMGDGLVMDAVAQIITQRGYRLNRDGTIATEPFVEGETDIKEYVKRTPNAISVQEIYDAITNEGDPEKKKHRAEKMLNQIYWALQRLRETYEVTEYDSNRLAPKKVTILRSHEILNYRGDRKKDRVYVSLLSWQPTILESEGRKYYIFNRVPVQFVMSDAWGQYRYIPAEAAAPPNILRAELVPYVAAIADNLSTQVKTLWNTETNKKERIMRQDVTLENTALMREIARRVTVQAEIAAKSDYPRPIDIELTDLVGFWTGKDYTEGNWPNEDGDLMDKLRERVAQDLVNMANWEHPKFKSIEYRRREHRPGYFRITLQNPRQPEIEFEGGEARNRELGAEAPTEGRPDTERGSFGCEFADNRW